MSSLKVSLIPILGVRAEHDTRFGSERNSLTEDQPSSDVTRSATISFLDLILYNLTPPKTRTSATGAVERPYTAFESSPLSAALWRREKKD